MNFSLIICSLIVRALRISYHTSPVCLPAPRPSLVPGFKPDEKAIFPGHSWPEYPKRTVECRRGRLPRPNIFICENSSSADGAGATLEMKRWGMGPWENFEMLEIWQECECLCQVFKLEFHLGILAEIFA